jgi:acetyl-CoA carboxylase biotin carboxyl carrier protein
MKAKEIQDLIDFISKTGLEEVNIETGEFKIKVKRSSDVAPGTLEALKAAVPAAPVVTVAAPAAAAPKAEVKTEAPAPAPESKNYLEIKSPMIGTFYRTPNPDSEAFVKVGDEVKAGQVVCIVEAMKLFNEIESEVSGTIVKVMIENGTPVEYDQVLFLVDPA